MPPILYVADLDWRVVHIAKIRSWTDEQLKTAIQRSGSYRGVLILLGLVPAGGNYEQVKRRASELDISTAHFTGKGWRIGSTKPSVPQVPLELLLVRGANVQSYKLKAKLFAAGLKTPQCEMCGWAKAADDGRIPVELDHINGDRYDNRISNLRVLCPNCHSLQPTHRGKNKKVRLRSTTIIDARVV